jgi:hypothetical protein
MLALILVMTCFLVPGAHAQADATGQDQTQHFEDAQDQTMHFEDANGVDAYGGINRNGHTGDDGPHGKLENYTPTEIVTGALPPVADTKQSGSATPAPMADQAVDKTGAFMEPAADKSQAATETKTLGGFKSLFR